MKFLNTGSSGTGYSYLTVRETDDAHKNGFVNQTCSKDDGREEGIHFKISNMSYSVILNQEQIVALNDYLSEFLRGVNPTSTPFSPQPLIQE
jgi:hypothetical protein